MNERIKELWDKAGKTHSGESWEELTAFMNCFAELIVSEMCGLALAEQKRYANITHRNMSECAVALGNFSLLMKDHFEDEL